MKLSERIPEDVIEGAFSSDKIAERCLYHADMILRGAGSRLSNYTMTRTRNAILSATIDLWEEAYRAGAAFAEQHYKAKEPPQ